MNKEFLWGSSTASHQVEGGNTNNWTEFENKFATSLAKKSRDFPDWTNVKRNEFPECFSESNYISGRAVDHYNMYEVDFDIMKSLKFNAYRFSIEWSRIFPEKGVIDEKEIAHYIDVLNALKKREIIPVVTIWHWTNPIWVEKEGGILGKNFLKYFLEYTEILSQKFKWVMYWVTVNEPEIVSTMSYFKGVWPPNKKGIMNLFLAYLKLMKCHREAYKILKKRDNKRLISFAHHRVVFEEGDSKLSTKFAIMFYRFFGNQLPFLLSKKYLDYIGLNHYGRNKFKGFSFGIVKNNVNDNEIVSDMGWELLPRTMYSALISFKKYNLPILITENGLADQKDKLRIWYIEEIVKNIKKAVLEGVDVIGYLHWSFIDNFEWDKGFWPKFGLVSVNRKTMKRTIRNSAYKYSELIRKYKDLRV